MICLLRNNNKKKKIKKSKAFKIRFNNKIMRKKQGVRYRALISQLFKG